MTSEMAKTVGWYEERIGPWFPLFYLNFAASERISSLTIEELGGFTAMLVAQAKAGGPLLDSPEDLAYILRTAPQEIEGRFSWRFWGLFRREGGRIWNPRLQEIMEAQAARIDERSRRRQERARKGAQARWGRPKGGEDAYNGPSIAKHAMGEPSMAKHAHGEASTGKDACDAREERERVETRESCSTSTDSNGSTPPFAAAQGGAGGGVEEGDRTGLPEDPHAPGHGSADPGPNGPASYAPPELSAEDACGSSSGGPGSEAVEENPISEETSDACAVLLARPEILPSARGALGPALLEAVEGWRLKVSKVRALDAEALSDRLVRMFTRADTGSRQGGAGARLSRLVAAIRAANANSRAQGVSFLASTVEAELRVMADRGIWGEAQAAPRIGFAPEPPKWRPWIIAATKSEPLAKLAMHAVEFGSDRGLVDYAQRIPWPANERAHGPVECLRDLAKVAPYLWPGLVAFGLKFIELRHDGKRSLAFYWHEQLTQPSALLELLNTQLPSEPLRAAISNLRAKHFKEAAGDGGTLAEALAS